jgi:hypothetical protein
MIGGRIRPRCQTFMKRLFHDRPSLGRTTEHLDSVCRRYGIEGIEIVKARADTKLVARGRHPEWGDVAVKAVDAIARPNNAYSDLHVDRMVASADWTIFPRIHALGLGYSITHWVEHRDGFLSGDDMTPLHDFCDSLRAWGHRTAEARNLSEAEVKSVTRFYVQTTIRRMLYWSARRCLSSCGRFVAHRRDLVGHIERMADLAGMVQLQHTMMLSDLNMNNVLYDGREERLVVVDFEAMRPGSFLFDAVFYLTFLIIKDAPPEVTAPLAQYIFSSDYMESDVSKDFFRSFAAYVLGTYMVIDGRDDATIERALAIIDNASA